MSRSKYIQCCAQVYPKNAWASGKQCTRAGSVDRAGWHYCRHHDPIARRSAKEKRLAEYQKQCDENARIRRIHDAAPELLEALETLNLVIGLTPIAGNKDALQEACDIARKAIAKAKGVQSLV